MTKHGSRQFRERCQTYFTKLKLRIKEYTSPHYSDVIIGAIASPITSFTIVYLIVHSGRPKKTPKFRITGLCEGNSPVTGEFPAQKASNAENVSIWWRHHESVNWFLFISGHGYKLLYVHKLEHLYYVHNIPLWAICFFNWDCDIDFCEQRFSSSVV